jgi:hypothetical protein
MPKDSQCLFFPLWNVLYLKDKKASVEMSGDYFNK